MDWNYPGVDAISTQGPQVAPLKVEPISRDNYQISERNRRTIQCHLPPCEIDFRPLGRDWNNSLREITQGQKKTESNIEEFKIRWNESSKLMENNPLKPLVAELRDQLASGKLNAHATQKVLEKVNIAEEEFLAVNRAMKQFREDMKELYGLDVNPVFRGKGEHIELSGLTISEANGVFDHNAKIHIDTQTGTSTAKVVFEKGVNGPIISEISVDGAMKKFQEHIKAGRRK